MQISFLKGGNSKMITKHGGVKDLAKQPSWFASTYNGITGHL